MKGINTPGQALDSGDVSSFSAPRDGVSHLAFPALAPERNLPADSFPLAPLGNDQATLLSLPGVGIKTANLTLNLGFQVDAICVDCHVHQIANRMGWVETKTPEQSEKALQEIMPRRFWIPLNELLVRYGQLICTPVSPFCSKCPQAGHCPKIGVQRSR
jgi:endonuclease-3